MQAFPWVTLGKNYAKITSGDSREGIMQVLFCINAGLYIAYDTIIWEEIM